MAIADRVLETTNTTGTSTYVLQGAPTGRRTFVQGYGSGATVTYLCESSNGVDWEIGRGVVTALGPDTLTRATIIRSSNSNNAVSWSAGSKKISSVIHADYARFASNGEIPTAGGTADALTLTYTPALTRYQDGQVFSFKVSNSTNTIYTPTLNINGVGAKNFVDREGNAVFPGHLVAGSILLVIYESAGDRFRIIGITGPFRKKLVANTTFFVATTGNDTTGSGLTVGSPWLTGQKAINYIRDNIDLNGYTATIKFADGTYTGALVCSTPFTGPGAVQIEGNTTTPANVVLNVSATCLTVTDGSSVLVRGVKFVSSNNGMEVSYGGRVTVNGLVDFGACSNYQFYIWNCGNVIVTSNYNITGGGKRHINCITGGQFSHSGYTVTLTGTPAFSECTVGGFDQARITIYSNTYSGAATGKRYQADNLTHIDTAGGGASYIPGNSAGSVSVTPPGYYS